MVARRHWLDRTRRATALPSFNELSNTTDSLIIERDVDENTPPGEDVESPVTATDADTTTLIYGLEGPHADLFSFDTRSGQIRTKAPLNHEDAQCGYVSIVLVQQSDASTG